MAKVKKKKRPIKTTKQKQDKKDIDEGLVKIEKEVQEGGLRLSWVNFIDAYIANGGNGVKAYQVAYPKSSYNTAKVEAHRLLTNPNITEELNHKLTAQKVTEESLVSDALFYVNAGKLNEKYAMSGAKMIETLMKTKGMLVDTKRVEFTGENPAIFPALIKPENAKKFAKMVKNKQRIAE